MKKNLVIAVFVSLALLLGAAGIYKTNAAGESPSSISDQVETKNLPYKATTVDECIREHKCISRAFIKGFERPGVDIFTGQVVKKWNGPLNIAVLGDERGEIKEKIEQVAEKLVPYFPYPIRVLPPEESGKANYVIVYSDDFRKDLFETYEDYFRGSFNNLIFDTYDRYIRFRGLSQATLPFYDENKFYYLSVTFLKKGNANELAATLVQGISFAQPIFMPLLKDYSIGEVNDLHLLLLKILYHPDIKTKFTALEAGNIFNQVYPTILKEAF